MLLSAVAETFILPPGLFVVLLALALAALLVGWRRFAVGLVSAVALLALLLSMGPVSDLLLRPLEDRYAPLPVSAIEGAASPRPEADAQAVVVLGGGQVPSSPELGGQGSPSGDSTQRLVYGALLARRLDLPLIISGGTGERADAIEPEAKVDAALLDRIGLAPSRVLLESGSRDTWENAADVARTYAPRRVYLVTSAFHMARAAYAFRRHGISVIPAPTDYLAGRLGYPFAQYLPSIDSLRTSVIALKEYEGLLYYRVKRHHQT